MTFDRLPGRNSGWWQPVVGGTMLTAGVGLHLPAALTGRGKWRLIGVFGLVASISGVAATGLAGPGSRPRCSSWSGRRGSSVAWWGAG